MTPSAIPSVVSGALKRSPFCPSIMLRLMSKSRLMPQKTRWIVCFFAYWCVGNRTWYRKNTAIFVLSFKAHFAELTVFPFIKSAIRPYKSDSPRKKSRSAEESCTLAPLHPKSPACARSIRLERELDNWYIIFKYIYNLSIYIVDNCRAHESHFTILQIYIFTQSGFQWAAIGLVKKVQFLRKKSRKSL